MYLQRKSFKSNELNKYVKWLKKLSLFWQHHYGNIDAMALQSSRDLGEQEKILIVFEGYHIRFLVFSILVFTIQNIEQR